MMTQNEMLLDYLRSHPEGITPREAMAELGIMRLAARVSDLRAMGHHIVTGTMTAPNRYGKKTSFACYRLAES